MGLTYFFTISHKYLKELYFGVHARREILSSRDVICDQKWLRGLLLFLCSIGALLGNPPPSDWQLITPVAVGKANGEPYFPLERAFDGTPAWDGAEAKVTGEGGAQDGPIFASRFGYIDFGENYSQLHIMETWTLYRAYSGGSHPGYARMWWDDDIDRVNDDGVEETRLDFYNAHGVTHQADEQWVRDRRIREIGGVIPPRRYLLLESSTVFGNRAREYAIVGYQYDGLVPPEYANALILDIDTNTVMENGSRSQRVGTLSLIGGEPGESYTLELDPSVAQNRAFRLEGNELWTDQSFDFEAQSAYELFFQAVAASDGSRSPVDIEVRVLDRQGEFDTNGVASAAVAAAYPEINEGDYVIWNATSSANRDIVITPGANAVSYPNKILIKGGRYNRVTLDLAGIAGGGVDQRIPISNFQGQVRCFQVSLRNGSFWRFTGQYDPELSLGDAGYRGCEQPDGETNFGYSTGTYGIWVRNGWVNESSNLVSVTGAATGWEIDHLEICDGGFAGMNLKQDNDPTTDMNDVHLHHLYIHDTGSEGIYLGHFNHTTNQHRFNRLTIEKCVIVRAGTEALQLGQLETDVVVRNNVFWGSLDWRSPFQRFQDHCVQIVTLQGGIVFEDNVLLGAANNFFNLGNYPKTDLTPNGRPIEMRNNVCWGCRGGAVGYTFPFSDGGTGWVWERNFFGGFEYSYDEVYPDATDTGGCILVGTQHPVAVTAERNAYDSTRMRVLQNWRGGQTMITETNNAEKQVLHPRFVNLLGPGEVFEILKWNHWTARIGESSGFPADGTNKGQLVTYQVGDVVQYYHDGETRFYRCLQEHTNQEPPKDGNAFWELMLWDKPGGGTQLIPPDDARLVEGSLYHQLGVGLRGNGLNDGDQDGLPDDWEQRHQLNPESSTGEDGADGNPDRDAKTNLEEYRMNTDPRMADFESVIELQEQGEDVLLKITPKTGRSWRLQRSTLLNNDWLNQTEWSPSEGETPMTNSSSDREFYRLEYDSEDRLDLRP